MDGERRTRTVLPRNGIAGDQPPYTLGLLHHDVRITIRLRLVRKRQDARHLCLWENDRHTFCSLVSTDDDVLGLLSGVHLKGQADRLVPRAVSRLHCSCLSIGTAF